MVAFAHGEQSCAGCQSGVMANQLVHSTSPYLLQHADNPVDWREWGPEALAEANQRDCPILLSVGYAACHWCHVMAHESFEDPATAAYMNEHFVNIKVDREERPDIDAVYIRATQAMTGQAGWPMTCLLTPDGEPFFAGTYFPAEPLHGMPAFIQVLQSLVDAWQNRRDEIARVGAQVSEHLRQLQQFDSELLGVADLDHAIETLGEQFDAENGGFGSAPKFPPSMALEFLLRSEERRGEHFSMVDQTLEAMARGGIYDQLGGGFARYSVDATWTVPHFEKMLYDNALLLGVYAHAAIGRPGLAERIAAETAEFMISELLTVEGGFASALDADSEGEEGKYYVWGPSQLRTALGDDDAAWVADVCSVTRQGTFERGLSTLQLPNDPDDWQRWERIRERLLDLRMRREKPERDDKVVSAWNGLAISSLTYAGMVLGRDEWIETAAVTGELLATVHMTDDGHLRRTSKDGSASHSDGVLDDYGCVASAFLDLLGVTGDVRWFERAETLLTRILEHFRDSNGDFFDTASDAEELIARTREVADNAHPSGTSATLHAFIKMAAITGESRWQRAADSAMRSVAGVARQEPRFGGWILAAGEAMVCGPLQVAVVGKPGQRQHMLRTAHRLSSPGRVIVGGQEGLTVPLFEGRTMIDGLTTAYACRGFVCDQPVTDAEQLSA